jgi:hypothetical protein
MNRWMDGGRYRKEGREGGMYGWKLADECMRVGSWINIGWNDGRGKRVGRKDLRSRKV